VILVDTSIWIDHLHHSDPGLVALLNRNDVLTHPMVVGELALGSLADRAAYGAFTLALAVCRVGYRLERAYYRHFARTTCPAWPPVEETKCSLVTEIRG